MSGIHSALRHCATTKWRKVAQVSHQICATPLPIRGVAQWRSGAVTLSGVAQWRTIASHCTGPRPGKPDGTLGPGERNTGGRDRPSRIFRVLKTRFPVPPIGGERQQDEDEISTGVGQSEKLG